MKAPASVSVLVLLERFYILYQGDDGSPLTYKRGDQHVLIGFVSQRKSDCSKKGFSKRVPEVFGRISFYREWIEKNMKDPTYCGSGPNAEG